MALSSRVVFFFETLWGENRPIVGLKQPEIFSLSVTHFMFLVAWLFGTVAFNSLL